MKEASFYIKGRALILVLPFLLFFTSGNTHALCTDIYVFEAENIAKEGKGLIIDVRKPYEYNDCHIPGSINIPNNEIEQRYAELDKDVPVVVYCRTAKRSRESCNILYEKGIRKVYNLAGGISAWYNTGRTLEGKCEGIPHFLYDDKGNVLTPQLKTPVEEPDVKGCK